jgi:oligoendopeptidase F
MGPASWPARDPPPTPPASGSASLWKETAMTDTTVPERKDVAAAHRWDLTPLFEADGDWEALFAEAEGELDRYDRYRGRLGESARTLKEAVAFHLGLSRRLDRLATYAHLKSDEDKSDSRYLGFFQRAVSLHQRAAEQSSFMRPELLALPVEHLDGLMAAPELAEYAFFFEQILRHRPHALDAGQEKLLAMSGEMAQAARQVFGQLDNVDMDFGTLADAEGVPVALTHGNFSTFLIQPDRDLRQRAFFQYYQAYDQHRHTLAATLAASVQKDLFFARARRHASCRAAALFSDNISETVYDNLLAAVKSQLPAVFDYLSFRRRMLGLDALHFYDTYVPVVAEVDFQMDFEEAAAVCLEALAPLGGAYTDALAQGFSSGWVDRYENRGKRSGAYSSGCYDSPPYILLNYEDRNLNSLYTLVHEAGHSMHTLLANRSQPYVYHHYTIFVAEVASTFNEVLLTRHLLARYRSDPRMQAFILNREIDNLRATLVRQTMFAEFENRTHRMAEAHEPLTVDSLRSVYREVLEAYFGKALVIDDVLELECLRIPHFYSAFYVYKYATGISAAIALADQVMTGGKAEAQRYLDFLSLGGSRYPLDALKSAGVDMARPEAVTKAMTYFGEAVDRLQAACTDLPPDGH